MKRRLNSIAPIHSVNVSPTENFEDLRTFVEKEVLPRTQAFDERHEFDHALTRRLFEIGILNSGVPREYGGPDRSLSDMIWIMRELGYGSGGLAITLVGNILGFSPIAMFGSPALKERLSKANLADYGLWSFAMTEAAAGSDLRALRTVARPVPGGFLLSGEKNYITNASYSSNLVIFAKTETEEAKGAVSGFYVPGDATGLTRGPSYKKMGFREADTGHLIMNNVFVPTEHMVGNPGDGIKILTKCLGRSKTFLAALAAGLATRALDATVDYLSSTDRYGKPLIEQPAIRHTIAQLYAQLEAAWLLCCKSGALWDAGQNNDLEASMAKMVCADTCFRVANECVELFGSRGFLADSEAGRILRDVKGLEIIEGPTLVQEIIISKILLSKNAAPASKTAPPSQSSARKAA